MYRFNHTGRDVLITPDEVVSKIASDDNVDTRYILNNIEIAEERYIVPVLGQKFYDEFCAMKNRTVTAGNRDELLAAINPALVAEGKAALTASQLPYGSVINAIEFVDNLDYVKLWKQYLWRLSAEAVDAYCTVATWLRHTAQGQQNNNPRVFGSTANVASGSRNDIQYKFDKQVRERVNLYTSRLKDHICKNIDDFPLYPYPCNCSSGLSSSRIAGVVVGLYDDDEETTTSKTSSMATTKTPKRLQFLTEEGQTKFPLVGQADEKLIRDELIGAEFVEFSLEGQELYLGAGAGEFKGLDAVAGEIEWNTPAGGIFRAILKYKK